MPESSIGNYTIIRNIGGGGMAHIYLASHRDVPSLRVILKVVSDPQLAERFRREAEKLAQLDSHPGICKIKHFFNHGRDFVIAMEYIEGHTLEERIEKEGKLPVAETLGIVDAVLDVLVFAHKRGIYHRDIKPSNIMIDADNRVKVIDFGIAKGEADPTLTAVNAYLGTPAYMAPEQFRSSEDINYAFADIYAIGTTMFQMLTGELPYKETDLFLLRDAKMFSRMPRPRKLRPDIPKSTEAIILHAMEKEPEERFPSVEVMRQAVQAEKAFPGGARGDAPKIKRKRGKALFKTAATLVLLGAIVAAIAIPTVRQKLLDQIGMGQPSTQKPASSPTSTSATFDAIAPTYGASFSSDDPVLLRWTFSNESYEGMYVVAVARDGQFRSTVVQDTIESNERSLSPGLAPGTYFWRVSTMPDDGDGQSSSIMSFAIIDAATPTGELVVSVNLPAEISIDGSETLRATTDLTRRLEAGQHVLTLSNRATNEREIVDTVSVVVDSTTALSYSFSWSPVAVLVRARPDDATISFNGGGRLGSPASVKLAPGRHKITVDDGSSGLSLDSNVTITPGRDTSFSIDLAPRIAAREVDRLRDSVGALDELVSTAERREPDYLKIVDWRSQIPQLLDTKQTDSARQVLAAVVTKYNDILSHRGRRQELTEQTVRQFLQAFAERNLTTMEQLYPTMPSEEKQNWATFFEAVKSFDVTWKVDQINQSGSSATADVSLNMSFTDRSGDRTENVPWRLKLSEQDNKWIITARDAR